MRKFILKIIALLCAVLSLPVILLLTVSPQYTHEYNAAFLDKIKRLQEIRGPKIVLVGNSNVAFGFQSDLIEAELKMPVVNLGLHAGLGNAFCERMALFNIEKGDIIVVSHLDYDDDDKISQPELALLTVENYFKYWKIFRPKDYLRLASALPAYSYKCLVRFLFKLDKEPEPATCYARSAFDERGDNVFPRNIEAGENPPYLRHPSVNSICMKRLNKFYERCKAEGALVVISGAPIVCGLPGFDADEYKVFQKKVEAAAECPVISDFSEYFFDKKYFFASSLHLTNDGAKIRSELLAKDLKNFLAAARD